MRSRLLSVYQAFYERLGLPLLLRTDPQKAHEAVLDVLSRLDQALLVPSSLRLLNRIFFARNMISAGSVTFDYPLIVAAGLVKGHGFASEEHALGAVRNGTNIIPGWRSVPALLGAVEFGSFTRYPRLGNSGTVVWRDAATHSTQNRIGLRNPGAKAAALFLHNHRALLPRVWGINLAVSPGVHDPEQEEAEIFEALEIFLAHGIMPSWFTLNLSCPNTEDDPQSNQTREKAQRLCLKLNTRLRSVSIPLWVKISPDLSEDQYEALMEAFIEANVDAVIATNTLSMPAPDDASTYAGVAGGRLFSKSMDALEAIARAGLNYEKAPDLVACGGILNGRSFAAARARGAKVCQYWTSLIYRGPLAAALIGEEIK